MVLERAYPWFRRQELSSNEHLMLTLSSQGGRNDLRGPFPSRFPKCFFYLSVSHSSGPENMCLRGAGQGDG